MQLHGLNIRDWRELRVGTFALVSVMIRDLGAKLSVAGLRCQRTVSAWPPYMIWVNFQEEGSGLVTLAWCTAKGASLG